VRDQLEIRRFGPRRQEPAEVTPQNSLLPRRMQVFRTVGMNMVKTMVRRPPHRPALDRRATGPPAQKMPDEPALERAELEVTAMERRQCEDAQSIEERRNADRSPTPPDPDDAQAHQVDDRIRNHARPIETFIRLVDRHARGLLGKKPTTDAAKERPWLLGRLLLHEQAAFLELCGEARSIRGKFSSLHNGYTPIVGSKQLETTSISLHLEKSEPATRGHVRLFQPATRWRADFPANVVEPAANAVENRLLHWT